VSGARLWERAEKPICEKGPVGVMISIWGLLSGTYVWLGLCHPRGFMCERGGVRGPFRVADKVGSGDL